MSQIPGYVFGEPPRGQAPRPPPPVDAPRDADCLVLDFARSVNCCLSAEEVLAILAPVVPDQLRVADRYHGLWEAYWAHWNDIDHRRLIKQVRIDVVGKACPRAGEPGSMVVLFQVIGA